MLSDTSVILNSELRLAYEAHQQVMNSQQTFKRLLLQAVSENILPNTLIIFMEFSKFDLSMKCESVECHITVLRFGSTLARKVEKLIGVAKAINGLHRIYVNIFLENQNREA